MNDAEINARIKMAQINNALGVFTFLFGMIVISAMFFTETFIQQMTDLTAGIVLVAIGGGMMWKAKSTLRKLKPKN